MYKTYFTLYFSASILLFFLNSYCILANDSVDDSEYRNHKVLKLARSHHLTPKGLCNTVIRSTVILATRPYRSGGPTTVLSTVLLATTDYDYHALLATVVVARVARTSGSSGTSGTPASSSRSSTTRPSSASTARHARTPPAKKGRAS